MKVGVIGYGSIGRRHAATLLELGHEVSIYDPALAAEVPAAVRVAASASECVQGADAAVIASPSSEHAADAAFAIELNVPVLVEKPLALDAARAVEIARLAEQQGVMLSAAMNLRELPAVRSLAGMLAEGAVGDLLRASAWCGSWLPGWRPETDYRQSYSARAELGGGVLLDVAVHELDYLLWLAGPARSVSALVSKVSELETDVEDVALIALELESGALANVTVDYFDRRYTRGCRFTGASGTLHWSWEHEQVTRYDESGAATETRVASDVAGAYRSELERFLAAVADRSPAPVPAAEACAVLAVLDAARVSSQEGRRVPLPPALELREAGPGDEERLLAWRNDPDTRRWSRSTDEVSPDEHKQWFARALRDPSMTLWIVESAGESVGHVRLTDESQGNAELHITIAPHARGGGLATAALTETAARALARPGLDAVCAHVKPQHAASLRAFARAGFTTAGADEDGLIRLERASIRRALTRSRGGAGA